jgi:surface protein
MEQEIQVIKEDFEKEIVIQNEEIGVIPTGTKQITENGTYDVAKYKNANVSIPLPTGTINIFQNGEYNIKDYELANVNLTSLYTGHADVEGLTAIGWTSNDINYFQQNGINWNEELDNYYKLRPDELTGVVSNSTRYMPKDTTLSNFHYRNTLIALPYIDFSDKVSWNGTFRSCYNLTTIPQFDTSSATIMSSLFDSCYNLISIPLLNTSNVTTMNSMFSSCFNLKNIPLLDTKNVTDMKNMFVSCLSLKSIPQFNTENVTTMQSMFNSCRALVDIPILNTSKVTNFSSMFGGCHILSENSINNILKMCINATSYTGTKTLSYIGLASNDYPSTMIQGLSNYQDFINAGWTIGY